VRGGGRSVAAMNSIDSLTLEVPDVAAARAFYATAFGIDTQLDFRVADAPASGFRGYTLSLLVGQPATVEALHGAALAAGAQELKPVKKSFWGVGGVVQAPDGAILKLATSARKDSGPATREIDQLVLLLGVEDVGASKRFYVDHGLAVDKSFPGKYVQFASEPGRIGLGLYGRKALAKDAGVAQDGSGSHRLVLGSRSGPFTDPDGFETDQPAVPTFVSTEMDVTGAGV
jgi:hypothetical protein